MKRTIKDPELILVVDDTPANLAVICEVLTEAGFEVGIATDGEMALSQVQYASPSLILLDVMMPKMDGFETCHRLKSSEVMQDIPVIFMTALSDLADKVKGFELGAVDYITKPFQEQEVLARVKTHLRLQNLNKSLEARTRELTVTLEQLQHSQLKLVQSEKMSSLGQLVAGIAHEINNPVNFISGNLAHANEYTQHLLHQLCLYRQYYPNPLPEIQEQNEAIDLNFLLEDTPKLFSSMKMGAERICNIVAALRTFSHMDEAEYKSVNIHDGIDSTLMILQHRLKAKSNRPEIAVIKHYGDLPLVECYAGQMNQVFMNLLSNAIDALEERDQQRTLEDMQNAPSLIQIYTQRLGADAIAIRIVDNGQGIAETLRRRLFEPFFTTKPVGKGTGMGLSISYQIVIERHGGLLRCISSPGEGAEFMIELPLRQKKSSS
jgi:signal transduction histidine kinase